jgi:hemerythrin-like domain-containing protein
MSHKCIDVLTAEHKTMLRIADVLNSMSKKTAEQSEYNPQDVEALFHILCWFGDELHQAKEEGALFPVFTKRCNASEFAAVRHMLFEHEQDRSLMSGIADAIARSNAPQFAEYAERLAMILRNHIFKEDNILFEMISAKLSSEDDERIVAEFEGFDRDFHTRHEKLMETLRALEWKYLRKIV